MSTNGVESAICELNPSREHFRFVGFVGVLDVLEFASLVLDGGALALFHWLVSFVQDCLLLLLLLFTRPLPRDGGMAEDHEAPEAEQLPRVRTRGRREIDSRQRVSGSKSP